MGESNLSESDEVVASNDHLSTNIDGETVILHLDSGTYYGLNEVASEIWSRLQEPRTVGELCEEILATYEISPDRCTNDVESVLADLADADLVEIERNCDGGS
ncbi:PqqD family protein [Natrarchaeobius oligotrophus]|uniref:PqqD family protein n=1 Tax=Natrarchaeobius chitinivorans TaxID=1679083 RepID=A0A3N6MTN0_NATCH|nr:PqqD family protein [Natrarchaeobius chitinivorans]RQH01241.1 PqqD family protein [Natrarchaeobius chitinivorans]